MAVIGFAGFFILVTTLGCAVALGLSIAEHWQRIIAAIDGSEARVEAGRHFTATQCSQRSFPGWRSAWCCTNSTKSWSWWKSWCSGPSIRCPGAATRSLSNSPDGSAAFRFPIVPEHLFYRQCFNAA